MNSGDRSAFQLAPNAFPEANLPVNMRGPVQLPPGSVRPRFGLMRAAIGASFAIRCKDGKTRAFTVREREPLARRLEEIRKDKKEPQPAYVCFHAGCRSRKWENEAALLGDHPDLKTMDKQEEAHVFALWCEAPELSTPEALKAWRDGKAVEAAMSMRIDRHGNLIQDDPIVGLLSEP